MIFTLNDQKMIYSIHGSNTKNQVIIIEPGVGYVDKYLPLVKAVSRYAHVILISLPGARGSKSDYTHSNPGAIAQQVRSLLDTLNIKSPSVIGISYGGNVGIELSRLIRLKAVVLVSAGEYFTLPVRILFSGIFFPSIFFGTYGWLFGKIYTRYGWVDCSNLSKEQIKMICLRWYAIIWYNLPKEYTTNIPTLIIHETRDKLVRPNSLPTLKKMFKKVRIFSYPTTHCEALQPFMKEHAALMKQHLIHS